MLQKLVFTFRLTMGDGRLEFSSPSTLQMLVPKHHDGFCQYQSRRIICCFLVTLD